MKAKVEIHNGNNGRSERKRNTMKTLQEEIKKKGEKETHEEIVMSVCFTFSCRY